MTGIIISGKNLAVWLTIAGLIITQITTFVLLKDQVRRNTAELEKHNLDIIEHELKDIAQEVDKINEKTDQIFTLVQEYLRDAE